LIDNSAEAQRRAECKVRAKLGFYWHLILYGVLNSLCLINYLVNSLMLGNWQYFWLPWSFTILSSFLLCHYLAVFVFNDKFRMKMIAEELYRVGAVDKNGVYDNKYLQAYRQAERKMVAKIGFYWHGVGYLIANFLCWLTYVVTSLQLGMWYYPWSIWATAGLTAGLFCHFMWLVLFWGNFRQRLLSDELRQN